MSIKLIALVTFAFAICNISALEPLKRDFINKDFRFGDKKPLLHKKDGLHGRHSNSLSNDKRVHGNDRKRPDLRRGDKKINHRLGATKDDA